MKLTVEKHHSKNKSDQAINQPAKHPTNQPTKRNEDGRASRYIPIVDLKNGKAGILS